MNIATRSRASRSRPDFLVRCLRGIEWIVAAEIETGLDAKSISQGHREVRFSVNPALPLSALRLASADDIFLVVGDIEHVGHRRTNLARLARLARELAWTDAVADLSRLRPGVEWSAFSISASSLGRRNYGRYEIEDRVAEGVAAVLQLPYRPTRAEVQPGPELSIRVHIVGSRTTLALRVFDTPLHRRRYKRRSCVGTLHPPLAAAMAMVAGLRPGVSLLDPFVGVGTVAIEAKLLQPSAKIVGVDIDHTRIRDAAVNAQGAGATVNLAVGDTARLPFAYGGFDRVVSNVPWQVGVPEKGDLVHSPEARDREIARVLERGGRAVLLVHPDDPVQFGVASSHALSLCHRSWLSVFGQHPRLCIFARDADLDAGPIDSEAPWGRSLLRNLWRADTVEFSMAKREGP